MKKSKANYMVPASRILRHLTHNMSIIGDYDVPSQYHFPGYARQYLLHPVKAIEGKEIVTFCGAHRLKSDVISISHKKALALFKSCCQGFFCKRCLNTDSYYDVEYEQWENETNRDSPLLMPICKPQWVVLKTLTKEERDKYGEKG